MTPKNFKQVHSQPENPLSLLVKDQTIAIVPKFKLESGVELIDVPVSYKTWGTLNEAGDNIMVICHALTGSADVEDWWGPLLGPKRAFDTEKFFVFCANVLGSPYGSCSPLSNDPSTGKPYWSKFPKTSIRDDVRLHRLVLEDLGAKKVAICIGGSLGGMQALEWAMFGKEFVQHVVPIATSGKHSAWGISWGEAQRQSIYSDPNYCGGNYTFDKPPNFGLAAARMSALLTYRSRDSFESRFGRKKQGRPALSESQSQSPTNSLFSAQSYLRYQGDKFVHRFDANCYIAITEKMDSHDVSRGKGDYHKVLAAIDQPALIVGIESDGLFTISEQYELAEFIPSSKMVEIKSPDGHDGFLLEFQQINDHIKSFIQKYLPQFYQMNGASQTSFKSEQSLFGEAEGDITEW